MNPDYQNRTEPYQSYSLKDYTFPPHLHNQLEIVYVTCGSCTVMIDQKSFHLLTNDIVIIFPYQLHNFHHTEQCELLVQVFSPEYAEEYIPYLSSYIPKEPLVKDIHKDVSDAIKKAHEYFTQNANPTIIRSYVSLFMSFLFPCLILVPAPAPDNHNILHNLLTYIDMHFTKHLNLDILAAELHVTKYYISRIFNQQLHTTFPDYLNFLRINYALDLLRNSCSSISQVALECGFESERTFFRVFRNLMKTSPLKYQKLSLIKPS